VAVVAGELGNTPAVCRASYVHPAVPATFLDGTLPARWAAGPSRPTRWLQVRERRLLHVLEHADEPVAALGALGAAGAPGEPGEAAADDEARSA
jgi:DNA topoisomerase IB